MTVAPVSIGVRTAVAATSGPKPDLAPAVFLAPRLMPSAAAAPGHAATTDALSGRILIIPIGSLPPGFFGQGGVSEGGGGTRIFTLPRGMGRLSGGGAAGGPEAPAGPTPREPLPGERQAYETNIHRVQDFWTKLGVGANEGNGRELPVEFLDN
ncbi:MAG: hypothetical protein H7123_00130 [Thermoleophilia bacterium]|nr:hypothetical protein [Thermoleophilia bacterium]